MKKNRIYYLVCWICLVALFNVICFVTPEEINGISKFEGAFWSGYGFIMATFTAHMIFSMIMTASNNSMKKVHNVSIMVISCVELALMVVCGSVCMIVPGLPNWIGIITCSIILAFSIISVVATKEVEEYAFESNENLNQKIHKYRELVSLAELSVAGAKNAETKAIATQIYEAIRYSDSVSNDATQSLENEIEIKLNHLLDMIKANEETEAIRNKAEDILFLIEERKSKGRNNL